jgi:amidase
MTPDLHALTAVEQAALIARAEISAGEILDYYLARSEQLDPAVGAFVRLTPELAHAQAEAVDHLVATSQPLPSDLAGVVCPVKDLEMVAGVPTTMGSAALEMLPDEDTNVVVAMREGGLVCSGKTTTPEFGLPCYTEPVGITPARSPWDLSKSAAGSSGGAAAAVAAGLAPVAQGSDGGGSIRLPASVCGIVGLKPSRGRVSNGPLTDGVGDLLCRGPLARTVLDAAALLDVLAVPFPGEPYRAQPAATSFAEATRTDPGRLRIGWYTDPVIGITPPTPEVTTAVADTVSLLDDLGHRTTEIAAPMRESAAAVFEVIWWSLADSVDLPDVIEAQLTPLTRWQRALGRDISGGQLAAAVAKARKIARDALTAMAPFDVILSPTAAAGAFDVGELRDDDDPAGDFHAQKQWAAYTAIYNMTGQPAVSLPLNWTEDGMPIGVQFAAAPGEDALLISLAAQLERNKPWRHVQPAMW